MKRPESIFNRSFEKEWGSNGSAGFTLIEILIAMAIFPLASWGLPPCRSLR
nr:prepilin-type N-terminal cleavage/methylation domain-containing protein [Desulfobacula sp.]